MSNQVQQQMVRGAIWMVLFKLMERSLSVISTLILVRLLSPNDFGVVSMATSFIVMAELLTAFGFDVALIQKQDATVEHYHAAWTLNVLLGAAIALLMLSAASFIAAFYKHPEVLWVVRALAFAPLISGFENIGVVAFRKDMQFRREFVFQLSRKLIGFLVVVPLAFFLRSYWALVAGMLTSKLVGTAMSYLMHPFRPRLCVTGARGLLGFSKWLLINNMVVFFKDRSSDFAIGRFLGAAPLGSYNVSYEFATIPSTELSAPINRALLPGFARITHDRKAMRAAYSNAIGVLAMIAVPAAAGIFAVVPFLVPVALGTKWLSAVPLMEILAIHGGLLFFHSSICAVLIANGYPDRVTRTNAVYVVILLILFGLLIPFNGIIGAAYAAMTTSILATPLYLLQVRKSVGIPTSVFSRAAARPVAGAVIMASLVRWLMPDWSFAMTLGESIAWLIGGSVFGVAVYAATVSLLWIGSGRPEGAERNVFQQLRERFALRRASPARIVPLNEGEP